MFPSHSRCIFLIEQLLRRNMPIVKIDAISEGSNRRGDYLVEMVDVPNHARWAAIVENGSFVMELKRDFDLVRDCESTSEI